MATSSSAGRIVIPQGTQQALDQWLEQGRSLLAEMQAQRQNASQPAANQRPEAFEPLDLSAANREIAALKSELESLEIAHFDLVCRNLGTLRLHSCHWLGEVLDTLVEISLNFIGVGAFVVYLANENATTLYPVAKEGVDGSDGCELPSDVVAKLALVQESEDELLVPCANEIGVLPFVMDGRLVGALRLIRPFAQKSELSEADRELLTLLREHGAIAIRRAWLTSTCTQTWWNATSLKALLN